MSKLESLWTDTVTTPDLTEWSELLERRQPFEANAPLSMLRETARQRLVEAAQQYVLRISELAQRSGIALPGDSVLTGDPQSQPIIMTGHQPVLFHGGLTFKYHCTEQAAIDQQAIAVAVMIDTDEGDSGAFEFPQPDPDADDSAVDPIRRGQASLSASPGLLGFTSLCPPDDLQQQTNPVLEHLERTAGGEAAAQFRDVADDYRRLAEAGATTAEANLVVRWSRGIGSRVLELPLSAISSFPEVLNLTASILARAPEFADAYNRGLQEYRSSRGITNQANPFPDLTLESGRTELPFWVLDGDRQTRQRLFVEPAGGGITLYAGDIELDSWSADEIESGLSGLLLRNQQLIPRGALITSVLRMLFADLFVHGIGGGHYDEFTSEFIRTWWNAEPPPFVVASGSRYLFSERRDEILRLKELNKDLRDLRYNPQRHFGQGRFTAEVEGHLQELSSKKDDVVSQLKTAHAEGRSAKDLGHQIQLVSDEMRRVVDDAFSVQLEALSGLTKATEATVDCRTYPWILFPVAG